MKRKDLATWLALLAGWCGAPLLYLQGLRRWPLSAGLLALSALGGYGAWRLRQYGLDDLAGAWLTPVGGLTLTWGTLQAMYFGLTTREVWNLRHNPQLTSDDDAGAGGGLTIAAVVLALGGGATVAISALVFAVQRYFELRGA